MVACCRVWATACSSACMGPFEGGHHYLHYLHHSLASGQITGNPLQRSCLENPRDGGAWWAAVSGVSQSWTRLKRLSSSSSSSMVEVMKVMATSFKRSHAHTAALSAPNPAAGHHRPMPLPETPGHSWASLHQSLVGSLLLSPGSWCAQGFVCALQESVSQSRVSSGSSMWD